MCNYSVSNASLSWILQLSSLYQNLYAHHTQCFLTNSKEGILCKRTRSSLKSLLHCQSSPPAKLYQFAFCLVHSSCYDQNALCWIIYKQQKFISHRDGGTSRFSGWWGLCLGDGAFFQPCLPQWKEWTTLLDLSVRALIPFHHLLKAPSLNTATLVMRLQHRTV